VVIEIKFFKWKIEMVKILTLVSIIILFAACTKTKQQPSISPIIGTWKLLKGKVSSPKDTVVTDYTVGQEMIKIITPTHFAFMRHNLPGGKDSTASYSAGGGRVQIKGNKYTEHLDYFNLREWENHSFDFSYEIHADTLVTIGVEKLEKLGIEQLNEETYIKIR
jgi:hypothetical protein